MGLDAVDRVVRDEKLLKLFNINENLWPTIRHSWNTRQMDF
jgi:Glutathionylspermidine synthase